MPDGNIATGMPAPQKTQLKLAAIAAQVDIVFAGEGDGGPGQAGHLFGVLGQTRHAAEFAFPILFAAFRHQIA